MHFRISVFFVCLLSLIRRHILSKIARGFPPTKWRFQVSLGTSCMLMCKLGKCYSWPGNIQNTQNGKYANEEPSNYGGHPYLIYFVFLRCFHGSWGKPIFTFAEVCWRALRIAILFALFAGLAALPCLELLPAVCGDCPCFRLLFPLVEWAHCQVLLKSPYFLAADLTGVQKSCQAPTLPGHVFFFGNMERPLLGGRCKETNQLPLPGVGVGGGIWSLSTLIFLHFQLYWFTSAGFQRRQQGEEKTLDSSACGHGWVTIDGSQVRQLW